jgi:hypothetical protein
MREPSGKSIASSNAWSAPIMLPWVICTPFGGPVVPEV